MSRPKDENKNEESHTVRKDEITDKRRKRIRRSIKRKKEKEIITVMYSNIQGVTKKKESLINIMEELNVDICLLAETMTRTFKIDGCRCFPPNKSVGQNVSVVLRNRLIDNDVIKLLI